MISAELLKRKRSTGYRSVAEELKEAGALYEDRDVVVDGNLAACEEPSDPERNGGSLCQTQKKGRWAGFYGSPDPDLIGAVPPAWVHLRRLGCNNYSLM